MNPKIPSDLTTLHKSLRRGEEISFIIPKKKARSLAIHFDRIYRSQKKLAFKRGLLSSISANFYALYVEICGRVIAHKGIDTWKAILVFETSWKLLAPLEGEDLDDGLAKVTFRGKKLVN